jgi:hypothetical protein
MKSVALLFKQQSVVALLALAAIGSAHSNPNIQSVFPSYNGSGQAVSPSVNGTGLLTGV